MLNHIVTCGRGNAEELSIR